MTAPPAAALAWLGPGSAVRVVAVIHATVELERALRELGVAPPSGEAIGRRRDAILGARVAVIPAASGAAAAAGEAGRIVVAEPDTEGRLAASLARHGEGRVGWYVVAVPLAAVRDLARGAGQLLSSPAEGPFGAEVLLLGGPSHGPHVILVEPAAVPSPAMTDRHPITFRSATAADAERIASLFTDEGYPSGPTDIVERLERFASPQSQVIVADHDGEVLGFIAVHAIPRFEHSDRVLRIMALVVDPGVRERGIGRLLMDEAERIGREVDAAFVEVTAGHHRPDAHRLYEELGYDGSVAAYLRKRL